MSCDPAAPHEPGDISSPTDRRQVTAANAERVRTLLAAAGADAVLSARPEDVSYLIPHQAFYYRPLAEARMAELVLLALSGDPVLFTMAAYVDYYASVGVAARALSDLRSALQSMRGNGQLRIVVPSDCPAALHALVESTLHVRPLDSDPLADARLTKSDGEIALLRAACRLAEQGMAAMLEACVAGAAECEVAAVGEGTMRRAGADALCFSTVVVSGPELGVMREVTSTRKLQEGDWVMVDGGCTYSGYNAEFARSLRVGGEDDLYSAAYRAVRDAQRAAVAAVRAGVIARDVDRIARGIISNAGFEKDCYRHITGHGIGTGVWERPVIAADAGDELRAGAVFSIEPGIFIPGTGGIRIEDLVLATDTGAELLTRRVRQSNPA